MKKYILIIGLIIIILISYLYIDDVNISKNYEIDNNKNITYEKGENNEGIENNEKEIKSVFSDIKYYIIDNDSRYISYKESYIDMSLEEVVKRVNLSLDYDFYGITYDSINKYTPLVLVNKYYNLGSDYVPNNLVNMSIDYAVNSSIMADSEAYEHFKDMCNDIRVLGLNIKAVSVYRSYEYQSKLYDSYLKNDTPSNVDTYSARKGSSEHQTGYAFDIYNLKTDYTNFKNTKEYEWVKLNSYKYGFIIRYTSDNSYITGYKDEAWHLRYVGINAAKEIYDKNITLEEYLLLK